MALLIIQPSLSGMGRADLHHKLGWLGAALAIGVVVMGVLAGLEAAARPPDSVNPPKNLESLGVILTNIVLFGLLAGLAIAFRHDSPYHKRFMMLATINLLQAAIVRTGLRLPGDFGAAETILLADFSILPLVAWDIHALRRVHPATLWGGLAILASLPIRFWASESELWLTTTQWAVDLIR
jgi:hypothetical protein